MTVRELVQLAIRLLEDASAEYVVVGAMAYFLYGRPRATNDADFVVSTTTAGLERVLASLPPQCHIDPQARMELFTATMRWIVNIEGSPLKLEFFLLNNDPHHLEEFKRRAAVVGAARRNGSLGRDCRGYPHPKATLVPAEGSGRNPHILSVQGGALDVPYIESWCERHGTRARLDEIRRSIPAGI